jgi:hypothetical protein
MSDENPYQSPPQEDPTPRRSARHPVAGAILGFLAIPAGVVATLTSCNAHHAILGGRSLHIGTIIISLFVSFFLGLAVMVLMFYLSSRLDNEPKRKYRSPRG